MKKTSRINGTALMWGAGALLFFLKGALSLTEWLRDIQFYWQQGWNFDLPPPGPTSRNISDLGDNDNFNRVLFGLPLNILVDGYFCFILLKWTSSSIRNPPPEARGHYWIGLLLIAEMLVSMFVAFLLSQLSAH